jgi:hypothetical protein
MNISFCSVVLSLIQGMAHNTDVPPCSQGWGVIAIDIAGGNKRTAVRYAPLMLTGSARTWLNSLPTLQINSWHDFQDAFIKNFMVTYKRLPRP